MTREEEALGGEWEAKELGFHLKIFHLLCFILSFKVLAYFSFSFPVYLRSLT